MYRLDDLDAMREALRLAAEGTALASPNPRVGAVVVRPGLEGGQIVGRGTHRYAERDHAEVVALRQAGAAARGGTLYITLEPCCHTGRTPPCTDAIVAAGIARVVAATSDPNPRVAGGGRRALEAAGIPCEVGCLEREALALIEDFRQWIRSGRPFVTLKAAVSLDGRIAPGGGGGEAIGRWISSGPARERVQQMRHEHDAILTGIGTALADDPLLTDRTKAARRRPLLRVVLDSGLRLPPASRLCKNARRQQDLVVLHGAGGGEGRAGRAAALAKAGARLVALPTGTEGRVRLDAALRWLGEQEITSVLLEAGSRLNGAMLAAGLVDKLVLFQAPLLLGDLGAPLAAFLPAQRFATALHAEGVGPDLCIEAYTRLD